MWRTSSRVIDSERISTLIRLREGVLGSLLTADQLGLHNLGIALDQARVAIDAELEREDQPLGPQSIFG